MRPTSSLPFLRTLPEWLTSWCSHLLVLQILSKLVVETTKGGMHTTVVLLINVLKSFVWFGFLLTLVWRWFCRCPRWWSLVHALHQLYHDTLRRTTRYCGPSSCRTRRRCGVMCDWQLLHQSFNEYCMAIRTRILACCYRTRDILFRVCSASLWSRFPRSTESYDEPIPEPPRSIQMERLDLRSSAGSHSDIATRDKDV
mmetsp:Transcript_13444/g.19790  ORF Transcript_13444/g.19790 Transcript_13444/m.19790 type:complete len:199 (-) Transcript_13444:509-1105(-)